MSAKVTVLLFLQDVYAVLLFTDQGGMQPYLSNNEHIKEVPPDAFTMAFPGMMPTIY